MKKNPQDHDNNSQVRLSIPGNPEYPAKDDIYSREKKETLDENDPSGKQKTNPIASVDEEEELDVPGAELDNADEMIGEEDEENNYYSLGGEDHHNLDENDAG